MPRSTQEYVGSAMVACLVRALGERARGLGLEQLAGVESIDALADPTRQLVNGTDDAIFSRAADLLRMPSLGLWFGVVAADERAFGALGYLARHSPTLSHALARVVRYSSLFTSGEATEVRTGLETFAIVEGAQQGRAWSPVMGDAVLASWLSLIRRLTGTVVVPIKAEFASSRPSDETHHRAHFGEVLHFESESYALHFENAILARPLLDADLVLGATLERQAQDLLGLGANEYPLLRRINELLANGEQGLEGVAQALAVHPRTLQRRLAELGFSWRTVQERYRREAAERLLSNPNVSLKKVALSVGFADAASFRRAFRRWNGRWPRGNS